MNKSDEIIERIQFYFKRLLADKPDFTGNIQLNFYQGNVTNVNKSESEKLFDK